MRSVPLEMVGEEKYRGLESYRYELEQTALLSAEENPENEK